jgi:hypothetical protein
LLVYAALLACDDEPAPNGGDTGVDGADSATGEDAGADDTGAADTGNDTGVNPGDGGPNDSGIPDECNPVDQTGCDTPPETKCVIEGGAPGTECVQPSPNDVMLGDPCTGQDCAAGLVCLRDAQTSTQAHCRTVCDLDSNVGCEALPGEYECRTAITMSNWGTCTELPPICDPYQQTPCEPDQACQPFLRRTGAWEFRCRTAGPVGEGMPCDANNRCQRELACVNDDQGNAACKRYCQDDNECTPPLTCSGQGRQLDFMFCNQ